MNGVQRDVSTAFTAMASPCVVLVDTPDRGLGTAVGDLVRQEAQRIEAKFSRYRPSIITTINQSAGRPIEVDAETADLLDYSALCHSLSEGRFDITSGALRRIWRFGAEGRAPSPNEVRDTLTHVGWQRVAWHRPILQLPVGMEIDFGGIGKEYAVDRASGAAGARTSAPVLINFGGDLRVSGPRCDGSSWRVAIEDVDHQGNAAGLLELSSGALATSGDTYRHIVQDGIRYGHLLDPTTGWPVTRESPRSVTVHAATCTEAGQLAKLALFKGRAAEEFLRAEGVRAWCIR